jgi:gliding motility associated protien GldN
MKRVLIILAGFALLCGTPSTLSAQDLKVEVYEKENIPKKKPVPYPNVREADVMWSKVIWRMVDLRERMNYPLYYPTRPIGPRMSLIDLFLHGVKNEGLVVYDAQDDFNEFKQPIGIEQVNAAMGAGTVKQQVPDENGVLQEVEVAVDARTDQVLKYLVKEKWFFDKQHSTLQVRVIGLCPIRVYPREVTGQQQEEAGEFGQELLMRKAFWVYYPEARNLLARSEIFNRYSDAQQISFDDFFTQRRFNGYIYAESNVQNNRLINEYTVGIESLLEADRIKNWLFDFEQDLWEY